MAFATVFDLDETLADSAASWHRVIGEVAARHGYRWTPRDWAAVQGTSTAHWSGYVARRAGTVTPEAVAAECVDRMADADFGLLPGAADLVATAAGLGQVALVSAAPRRYVDAAVTALGLTFRETVAGEDVAHGKPAPDPYLLAARLLGVDPADCVAVEDSGSGIRSAHAAGMTVIAIPNPSAAQDTDVLRLAHHVAADASVAAKILDAQARPITESRASFS